MFIIAGYVVSDGVAIDYEIRIQGQKAERIFSGTGGFS